MKHFFVIMLILGFNWHELEMEYLLCQGFYTSIKITLKSSFFRHRQKAALTSGRIRQSLRCRWITLFDLHKIRHYIMNIHFLIVTYMALNRNQNPWRSKSSSKIPENHYNTKFYFEWIIIKKTFKISERKKNLDTSGGSKGKWIKEEISYSAPYARNYLILF